MIKSLILKSNFVNWNLSMKRGSLMSIKKIKRMKRGKRNKEMLKLQTFIIMNESIQPKSLSCEMRSQNIIYIIF